MTLGILAAIAYGLLAIIGGLIGYLQARSRVSLITGSFSGLLLLLGAFLWWQGLPAGAGLSLGITAALVIVFLRRWFQTRKAMPAALMIGCGVIAFAVMYAALTNS